GSGGSNHGAHKECCALICHRTRLEARALGGCQESLLLRPPSGQQWATLLIVLVGLVGKATNERETAEFHRASPQRPASPRTEDQSAKTSKSSARAQFVFGKELLQLGQHLLRCTARRLYHGITRMA